jgi:aspartyl-tRNA(Asn)/glutamyl-tRNA(Gln) amidotransferase subunit A
VPSPAMLLPEYDRLDAVDLAALVRRGEVQPRELVDAAIERIEARNPAINAVVHRRFERAREEATRALPDGPLRGVPFLLKDLLGEMAGEPLTGGCRFLRDFRPGYDAEVVRRYRAAGLVILGRTNTPELGLVGTTEPLLHGPCRNPWDRERSTGGSSGGSAAAVAARLLPAATGTDTGGSIRQPAAFCGLVGLKPTYGRCSRWGIVAFASSLDQAGPMTRTVRDAAIMLRAMAGHDPKDSTSVPRPVPDYEKAMTGDVRGLKFGIPKEYRLDGMAPEIEKLWQQGIAWLKAAGAEPVEISLPHTKYALPAYYIIAPAEASSNLARYDGVRFGLRVPGGSLDEMYENTRAEGFGAEVRRRVMIGTYVLSAGYYDAYYLKAQRVRSLIARDFTEAYKKCDVILTPTAPSGAFAIGEKADDPIAMYLNDVFTVTVNLAGLPGISVPAGMTADGLPLGLQLIGRAFDEEMLFRVAGVVERAANFTAKPAGVG